jgi:hypothetical protein
MLLPRVLAPTSVGTPMMLAGRMLIISFLLDEIS